MLFDHHIHSRFSKEDSLSEIGDIIDAAKRCGLGGIAISDHNEIGGSLAAKEMGRGGILVIPSVEVSSADGHIIALGVGESMPVGRDAKETIDRIHELGGIAIAAHPYDRFRRGVGDLSWKLDFDAIEINGHCLMGNRHAAKIAKRYEIPLVGGSDAHAIGGIGSICTKVSGETEEEIVDNIRSGLCTPVFNKNKIRLKASIITDKISRKYNLNRTL